MLDRLSRGEWEQALDFCDRSQLTLALRRVARVRMPPSIRERTDADARKNRERLAKLRASVRDQAVEVRQSALVGDDSDRLSGNCILHA